MDPSSLKDLVEFMAKSLVDKPDEVEVNEVVGEQTTVVELKVAKEDLGKVIGKQGRTARSMRNSFSPPVFTGYYNVGWIKSAHGIRGELFLRTNADRADWAEDVDTLALLPKGGTSLEEFKIVSMSPHKDGWIVKLLGVTDRNRAEELAKSSVYIDENLLEAEPGKSVYLKQILGFEVVDKNGLVLGRVRGFSSNGPQDLLNLELAGGGEALVPLVDAFLVFIDFDKKQITMDLPPGLINLEED